MNERKEVTLTIRGYETVADILEGIRNAGFTIVSEHPVNPPDEALREALRAKIAEWRAAAKKWGDNYLISGSESSRIISRCLTERADEIESLLDAPEPPGSVAGDEYDDAAREWELKESCDGNEDDLKWLKDRVIRLAAHFRAACVKPRYGPTESVVIGLIKDTTTGLLALASNEGRLTNEKDTGSWATVREWRVRVSQLIEMIDSAARAKQGKETRT